MKSLRAMWRLFLYLGFTSVMYAGWLAGTPLAVLSRDGMIRWRIRCFKGWARVATRILGVRLTVEGTPPEPPFFLVSNHLGYLDILVYASQLDGRFVAKSDVGSWPVLGILVRSMGTIFVNRGDRKDVVRVNREIERTLGAREGVILFAEGTSTGGDTVRSFKPSLLDFAARKEFPVHVATIWYRTRPDEPHAHESVCWWGDMTFGSHFMNLLHLSEIETRMVFGAVPVRACDRKQLAAELHHQVQSLFTPVIQEEGLCLTHPS